MNTFPRRKIILIDDDPISNLVNKRIIEKHYELETVVFTKANDALRKLRQWLASGEDLLPDIIFLDIDMPEMNGWEFLEALQTLPESVLAHCHIFILSSSIDFEDIEKSKTYKVVRDFISKPLTPDKLKDVL